LNTRIIDSVDLAAQEIIHGNIVALPTETVYGLGADAMNAQAVLKIYETKKRPEFNPLIVHVFSIEDFKLYTENIPDDVYKIAEKFSPGPVTYVLKKNNVIPDIVSSGIDTIALRIPNHPMFREVLEESGKPIAAPSANMFGRISPTTAEEVRKELEGAINYILDGGKCEVGIESTVLSFDKKSVTVLRPGFVTKEEIESLLGKKVKTEKVPEDLHSSPGLLKYHYSPVTGLYITENTAEAEEAFKKKKEKFIVIDFAKQSLKDAAINLFTELRKADESGVDYIITTFVENEGIGRAINDRLFRASSGRLSVKNGKITFQKK
jgi:L-threonylcarbamoyladenylate synthase